MKRGSFFRFRALCLSVLLALLVFSLQGQEVTSQLVSKTLDSKKDPAPLLLDIYQEVKELGFYENEDFLRREFQMNLDGNDNNKEEYVMVFSQTIDGAEKMVVQVTYFIPEKDNWMIKHAVKTKEIKCSLKGDNVKISSCDYNDKEIRKVLTEILEGIRLEKELLKLIRKGGL
jgi:hypothetical protein